MIKLCFLIFLIKNIQNEHLKISDEYNNVVFGTKGSYRKLLNGFRSHIPKININNKYKIQVAYLLSRHGARYPTESSFTKMKEFIYKYNHTDNLYIKHLNLAKFKKGQNFGQLSRTGRIDQHNFGIRTCNLKFFYLKNL